MMPNETQLIAGTTWQWSQLVEGYSAADGYALTYLFAGPAKLSIDATADADGVGFVLEAAADKTKALAPGSYAWAAVITKDAFRVEIARGAVEIVADLADMAAGADTRSHVKRTLDAIRAVLEGRAGRIEAEYQINGRLVRLMPPSELREWEKEYAARYRQELRAAGQLAPIRDVVVRFS